jgi:hypothetical protein
VSLQPKKGEPLTVRTARSDRIGEFQSAGTDNQIDKRQVDAFSRLLSADAGDDFRCGLGDRMDGNVSL